MLGRAAAEDNVATASYLFGRETYEKMAAHALPLIDCTPTTTGVLLLTYQPT